MKDRQLCCPPCFFLGPAVAPHFFHSRITTVHNDNRFLHMTVVLGCNVSSLVRVRRPSFILHVKEIYCKLHEIKENIPIPKIKLHLYRNTIHGNGTRSFFFFDFLYLFVFLFLSVMQTELFSY